MKKGIIHIGLSGWSYSNWKGVFYPEKMKSADFLPHYALTYDTGEINSSFYHLPRATTIEGWMAKVPAGFKFCVKMSRYVTHIKRLKEPEEPLERFFTVFEPMKKMMGPVLLQLPASVKFDPDITKHLFEVLKQNYSDYQFALEVRNATWYEAEAYKLMRNYNIAFVISESGLRFPYAEVVTSKNIYVRFHGAGKLYGSPHSNEDLEHYAAKFRQWQKEGHTIWAYFNNTMYFDAINNANHLKNLLDLTSVLE